MPTPDFVLALRDKVGTALLWLTGVTAVILRDGEDGQQVLLVRRSDNGAWTPVTGIIDPGEQPAVAAAREALEEASVVIEVEALSRVFTLPPMTYPNGDQAQYLDLTFRCRHVSGDAAVGDDENSEVGWYSLDALPEMSEDMLTRIRSALTVTVSADHVGAHFES